MGEGVKGIKQDGPIMSVSGKMGDRATRRPPKPQPMSAISGVSCVGDGLDLFKAMAVAAAGARK